MPAACHHFTGWSADWARLYRPLTVHASLPLITRSPSSFLPLPSAPTRRVSLLVTCSLSPSRRLVWLFWLFFQCSPLPNGRDAATWPERFSLHQPYTPPFHGGTMGGSWLQYHLQSCCLHNILGGCRLRHTLDVLSMRSKI